jgi:hypothetical protein
MLSPTLSIQSNVGDLVYDLAVIVTVLQLFVQDNYLALIMTNEFGVNKVTVTTA